ncbi:MAG: DUF2851 family protein [Bacteroidaceae bacterium]|nr:DUF2851 family protein [Bacteroidaceae bacterium]
MEYLLHYTWKHRLFPLEELTTTDGQSVEVVDPGLRNTNAGPDFFNAKVKIGGTLWVGNVEIHTHLRDWYAHGHQGDRAYDNVVLHVVEHPDGEPPVADTTGRPIPTLALPVPQRVKDNYHELMRTEEYPRCHRIIPTLPRLTVHSYLSALHTERLTHKAERIGQYRLKNELNWENAFFMTLARNFGFGVNGEAFEEWAAHIPLRAVNKHRDDLARIEAIFFGQAGLLQSEATNEGNEADEYLRHLQREYAFLANKFELKPMDAVRWRFLRMRPGNFPHVRLAQLAYLYYKGEGLLSRLLDAPSVEEIGKLLVADTSEYWQTHYTFGHPSPRRTKQLSQSTRLLLIINTISPFLYAYGQHQGNEALCQRAVSLLEELKAEDNRIIRIWRECGLKVESAADSQALIQLKREYCDVKKCLHCRFGYEYLKRKEKE